MASGHNQNLFIVAIVGIVAVAALVIFSDRNAGEATTGAFGTESVGSGVASFDTGCLDRSCKEECKNCDILHPIKDSADCKTCQNCYKKNCETSSGFTS